MFWKSYFFNFESNPDVHQWNELLGKSPWDFVQAPQWADADMEDEWADNAALPEIHPGTGTWEINPITGVKVWIRRK